MADLGFTSIGHVAIRANDLENVVAFYTGKLGLAEMFRLNQDDGSLMLVYLRLTDDQYIEIFPNGVGEPPARNAVGYTHLCLAVSDLEATVAALEAAGVTIDVALKTGKDNNRQAWISDPEGNRIELMEMAADSLQSQAIARLKG
ncbi:MAG TPA: VOC family protein [Thermomicrobiales bacterium]|jgi:lactoylglutathione lyase